MATELLESQLYSLPAAADLSAHQYEPVVVNTSGQVALAGANVVPHGHLQNLPKQGEMARFVHNGKVVKAKAGTGGVTVGAKLATIAGGYAVATTGQAVVGIALEAVSASSIFTALLIPGLPVA